MEFVTDAIKAVNGFVWGPAMLVLILGTGLYLSIGLRLLTIRYLGYAFRQLWKGRYSDEPGDISPFNALMTSLSATIGTGNITGVATAVFIGGPGALFWMWCTALVGMATKFAEAVLAVRYREVDAEGNHVGGPMYYIRNGLGKRWAWLGVLFAVFGALAGFGIGNTIQANSVADALGHRFGVPEWVTGVTIAILAGLVLIGGIQRIARVAGRLVPFMAIAYIGAGLVALALEYDKIPQALMLIVQHAFTPTSAVGGFAGASVMLAVQWGVARGIFSNEAGLGSAPIAHAAAKTTDPVRQGTIAMLGTFIDTILICSITGLVIVVSGEWQSGANGAELSVRAFGHLLPQTGGVVVSLGQAVFAFTTILGWSVYGERCTEFLLGERAIWPFRVIWVLVIPVGTVAGLDFLWLLADTLNALMAIPNLVALLLLSPVVFRLSREYFERSAR